MKMPPNPNPSPSSALVVDDDYSTRVLLRKLLENEGFQVLTAADGDAALQLLRSSRFDAILLDLLMPGVDGFAVVDELRREQPDTMQRVIVASAYPHHADRIQDAFGRIEKPVRVSELRRLLRALTTADSEPV